MLTFSPPFKLPIILLFVVEACLTFKAVFILTLPVPSIGSFFTSVLTSLFLYEIKLTYLLDTYALLPLKSILYQPSIDLSNTFTLSFLCKVPITWPFSFGLVLTFNWLAEIKPTLSWFKLSPSTLMSLASTYPTKSL